MCENCVFCPSCTIFAYFADIFVDIFGHFVDILWTFPFSALSNDLPVRTYRRVVGEKERERERKRERERERESEQVREGERERERGSKRERER